MTILNYVIAGERVRVRGLTLDDQDIGTRNRAEVIRRCVLDENNKPVFKDVSEVSRLPAR